MTHFDLFNLAPSVDLDVAALETQHRKLAMEWHPDRAGSDHHARRLAAEKSAALNDAIKVLKDPVRRAFYVLELKGVKLDSDQSAARVKMPMDFLEEIMEQREALDAVKATRKLDVAHVMAVKIRDARDKTLEQAQRALRRDDVPAATTALGRVRYYTRFLEEVDAFEEELLS
ncbi:MAG: Fe-S protein assembly co-chaperone HscB [Archangium sp.]|nr:Fe-S protein assembly co-chaperone HscB [Archangium sp.]MDP3157693.1 Fe-S protein assembly co-chaperone HscB [Archangium sp.]MDP3575212.1 Fe-S protein assembly co-chaperone HscB [Archangium sp.]